MSSFKKTLIFVTIFTFFILTTRAFADETMEHTVKSALYGGVIGGLVGGAVVLLTDNPGDHLAFIPSGAAVGILLGTAYGLATSDAVRGRAFGEIENGEFSLRIPSLKSTETFDKKTNRLEVVKSVDLLRVRF
ncbi:MAG: hypothetical protein ACE5EB_02930 [Thermodesulfobacteriota bacterium]